MSYRINLKESQIYLPLSTHITTPPIRLIILSAMKIIYTGHTAISVNHSKCRMTQKTAVHGGIFIWLFKYTKYSAVFFYFLQLSTVYHSKCRINQKKTPLLFAINEIMIIFA